MLTEPTGNSCRQQMETNKGEGMEVIGPIKGTKTRKQALQRTTKNIISAALHIFAFVNN